MLSALLMQQPFRTLVPHYFLKPLHYAVSQGVFQLTVDTPPWRISSQCRLLFFVLLFKPTQTLVTQFVSGYYAALTAHVVSRAYADT
jgi:hypothetical protein